VGYRRWHCPYCVFTGFVMGTEEGSHWLKDVALFGHSTSIAFRKIGM